MRLLPLAFPVLLLVTGACSEAPTAAPPRGPVKAGSSAGPVVSEVNPSAGTQGTTLDVHVLGSGFDRTSSVDWLLSGVPSDKIHTNSTRYISSGDLVVNVTISPDASLSTYDVQVTTGGGKKGIGVEKFSVLTPVDLGTFGFASISGLAGANESGWAVIQVADASRPFAINRFGGAAYQLPLPAGATSGRALGMSGFLVSGIATLPNEIRAVRWSSPDSGTTWHVDVLPYAPGTWNNSQAQGINARGEVVGVLLRSAVPVAERVPVVWTDSGAVLLRVPSEGTELTLYAISDGETVVGTRKMTSGKATWTETLVWRGLSSSPEVLPAYTARTSTSPAAINSAGVIVGSATASGGSYAARWVTAADGRYSGLPEFVTPVGGSMQSSAATAINTQGVIAGVQTRGSNNRGFVWRPGGLSRELPPAAGYAQSEARALTGTNATVWGLSRPAGSNPAGVTLWFP